MILYFTGTGNSRFIAKRLGERLGDEVVNIADDLRGGRTGNYAGQGRIVVVTPDYMSRVPLVVERYLAASTFTVGTPAWFVLAAGEAAGKAAKYAPRVCDQALLAFQGLAAVKCPANYVVMYDVTPKEQAAAEMAKALPAIDALADRIAAGERIELDPTFAKHNAFSAIAPAFMRTVSAKGFHANDACVSCGTCARVCPLGNVELQGGRPVWGATCTHCMACISACPQRAIDYGKKTQSRNRYYLA